MAWALARAVLTVWLVAACGGHTEGGTSEPSEPSEPSGPRQGDIGSGNDEGSPSPGIEGDTPLGECTLGFPPYRPEGRACPWLADDLCYESRDMACNCICPRDRDSQCVSGFDDGPDGRVDVYCR